MKSDAQQLSTVAPDEFDDDGPLVGLTDLLTWIGEGKRLIAAVTLLAALAALAVALLLTPVYTARATLLAPGSQQQGGSAAALAALGALGGLGGMAGLAAKTPDELYVALLKSDSVQRDLARRFDLMTRYEQKNYEALRKVLPKYIRVTSDKKSGLISVEVDDEAPKFAADLANAHADEVNKVLGRLAVSEAQLRRVFFAQQLKDTKENLVKAEHDMQLVQEKTGVIVLDKQAEALIGGAAQVRAQIAEREVQLKVLRTWATEQNPDVHPAELRARGAARRAGADGVATRAASRAARSTCRSARSRPRRSTTCARRRELKLQETLLESMVRQYEIAKLDEAKEGPALQQVDIAQPPDHKSKPSRALIVLASALLALLASSAFVVVRRYSALARAQNPERAQAWEALTRAWSWRRRSSEG